MPAESDPNAAETRPAPAAVPDEDRVDPPKPPQPGQGAGGDPLIEGP